MKSASFLRGSLTLLVLLASALGNAHAAVAIPTPEIDPSLAAGGLTLLAGTIVMIRGRRRK